MNAADKDLLRGFRILAVDDEQDSLTVLTLLLDMVKVTVFSASNGQEALDWLTANPLPDLVITDLSMPVMDGWTLFEKIKADPKLAMLPVFAFTAHAMKSDREKVLEAGFHQYLTKPLDPMTFVETLAKLIRETPLFQHPNPAETGEEKEENHGGKDRTHR